MHHRTPEYAIGVHTHFEGPLCKHMTLFLEQSDIYEEDPISRYYGIYPALPAEQDNDCGHYSCQAIVYEFCMPCEAEGEAEQLGNDEDGPFYDAAPYPAGNRPDPKDHECIHPGVFATERPSERCGSCGRNIPRSEL
jgi:hypothetical protein